MNFAALILNTLSPFPERIVTFSSRAPARRRSDLLHSYLFLRHSGWPQTRGFLLVHVRDLSKPLHSLPLLRHWAACGTSGRNVFRMLRDFSGNALTLLPFNKLAEIDAKLSLEL
jgi:hypothetical protein